MLGIYFGVIEKFGTFAKTDCCPSVKLVLDRFMTHLLVLLASDWLLLLLLLTCTCLLLLSIVTRPIFPDALAFPIVVIVIIIIAKNATFAFAK